MVRVSTPAILSLAALALHYSVLSVVLHLSRTHTKSKSYKASSAVALTEIIKILVCILLSFVNGELRPVGFERKRLRIELEQQEREIELDRLNVAAEKKVEEKEKVERLHSTRPIIKVNTTHMKRKSVHSEGVLTPRTRSSLDSNVLSARGYKVSIIPPTPGISESPNGEWNDSNLYPGRIDREPLPPSPSLWILFLDMFDLDIWYSLKKSVFGIGWWKLSVPAALFVFQNIVQYLASSNLSVPTFQLAYQLKIPATALCSVFLLKRKLSPLQWCSLGFLTIGVGIVQLNTSSPSAQSEAVPLSNNAIPSPNHALGLLAVIFGCISSGFSSTYFEKVLKAKPTSSPPPPSVWIRNIQLSFFGLIALLPVIYYDQNRNSTQWEGRGATSGWIEMFVVFSRIGLESFLEGFDGLTWVVVGLQVIGGLLGALVIKYSDNVAKVYATSLSTVISCVVSVYLFNFQLNLNIAFGATLVLLSTYIYSIPPSRRF